MSAARLDQSGFAKALGQDREYIFSSLKGGMIDWMEPRLHKSNIPPNFPPLIL